MKKAFLFGSVLFSALWATAGSAHDPDCKINPGLFIIDQASDPDIGSNIFNKDGRLIILDNPKKKGELSLFVYDDSFGILPFKALCEGNAKEINSLWADQKTPRKQVTCSDGRTGISVEISMVGFGKPGQKIECKARLKGENYNLANIDSFCDKTEEKCVVGWSVIDISSPTPGTRPEIHGTAAGSKF